MHDDEKKNDDTTEASTSTAPNPAADLDVEALDLTVEKVEERISPGETNVFDK